MTDPEQTIEARKPTALFLSLAAAAVAAGAWKAWALWFVNDDAFISFRYAKHLAEGFGLVYNQGERVEGFTNFLWTVLVAGAMKLGGDPVAFSVTAGILCFVATLALWAYVSWRLRPPGEATAVIPLTAMILALHRDMNVYATSGLETSFYTLLVSAFFALVLFGRSARSLLLAGITAVLMMMTRPDGAVFLAAAVAFIALTAQRRIASVAWLLLPVAAGFLPYWLWRYGYYGYFFPNAYYAKSIDLPYYSQGLEYTRLYFTTYYVFILIPVLAAAFVLLRRRGKGAPAGDTWRRAVLLAALFAVFATAFIIRIGGDFMFARFFIPATPMLALLLELLIQRLSGRGVALAASAAVLILTLLRYDQFGDDGRNGHIADEWRWYPSGELEQTKRSGELLRGHFGDLPVKVAYWAGQAKLMYYADPPVAIEASAGLTDTAIAHRAVGERGRPGHEKRAPLEYLAERGVNFFFYPLTPPPGPMPANLIVFDSIPARIVTYDDSLMSVLALRPGVHFMRFPEFLDRYIAELGTQPGEQVESDYRFFKTFYFDRNRDTAREARILNFLQRSTYAWP